VAIGIALDSVYSAQFGMLAHEEAERVLRLLERLGFRLWDDALGLGGARPVVLDGIAEFREHLGGELAVTLLEGIGRGVEVHAIDERGMIDALEYLRRRQ
jgi:3-dehydroquinate synthase